MAFHSQFPGGDYYPVYTSGTPLFTMQGNAGYIPDPMIPQHVYPAMVMGDPVQYKVAPLHDFALSENSNDFSLVQHVQDDSGLLPGVLAGQQLRGPQKLPFHMS